jgi:uncharacterized protein YggT (Ycf19 family)
MPTPNQGKSKPTSDSDLNRDRRQYDEFRETLATPLPNRAYRDRIETPIVQPTPLELTIRVIAILLSALIAVRLLFGLFNANHATPVVNLVYGLTDWIVQPFQSLFGTPGSGIGGYFDWPAVAAIIVVGIFAGLLVGLIRPRVGDE